MFFSLYALSFFWVHPYIKRVEIFRETRKVSVGGGGGSWSTTIHTCKSTRESEKSCFCRAKRDSHTVGTRSTIRGAE